MDLPFAKREDIFRNALFSCIWYGLRRTVSSKCAFRPHISLMRHQKESVDVITRSLFCCRMERDGRLESRTARADSSWTAQVSEHTPGPQGCSIASNAMNHEQTNIPCTGRQPAMRTSIATATAPLSSSHWVFCLEVLTNTRVYAFL